MDSLFILRVALSFIIGGGYIALISRLSEVFGAKVSGVLSGTPTTALVGMIFLAIAEGPSAIASAAPGTIVGMSGTMLFLVMYLKLRPKHRATTTVASALSGWFLVVIVLKLLSINSLMLTAIIYIIAIATVSIVLTHIEEVRPKKKTMPASNFVLRVLFAGTVVSSVLIASRVAGPFWGGVAAGFPAMFVSNIVILEKVQGQAFAASVIKFLPIGSLSVFIFSVVINLTANNIGSVASIAVAFLCSLVIAYGVFFYKSRSGTI